MKTFAFTMLAVGLMYSLPSYADTTMCQPYNAISNCSPEVPSDADWQYTVTGLQLLSSSAYRKYALCGMDFHGYCLTGEHLGGVWLSDEIYSVGVRGYDNNATYNVGARVCFYSSDGSYSCGTYVYSSGTGNFTINPMPPATTYWNAFVLLYMCPNCRISDYYTVVVF